MDKKKGMEGKMEPGAKKEAPKNKYILHEEKFVKLHELALGIVKRIKRDEIELIEILMKIDGSKTYAYYKYSSLCEYAIKGLGLSEAVASNFITVARKAKALPQLKTAIQKEELSVATARKISSVINKENTESWIQMAKVLPKAKLEKEVARVNPKVLTPERAKYVTESRLELRLGVSEITMEKLKRAQDIVAQSKRSHATFEDTLEVLLTEYLQRKDPMEKAKRNAEKEKETYMSQDACFEQKTQQSKSLLNNKKENKPTKVFKKNTYYNSRYIPAPLKHNIYMRDNGKCTHMNNGKRCENRRWLDIHHKIPLAEGGKTTEENLITLCSAHHRQQHAPTQ